MVTFSILFLLLSNAVALGRDKSILYSRVAILILLSGSLIVFQSLYFSNLANGISLFGGLFHATTITHVFQLFILLISSAVLLLTSFYPRKVRIAGNSSIRKVLSYKFLSCISILCKIREQFLRIESLLFLVFIVTIAISLVSSADLVSMLFSIMMLIGFLCFYYPLVLVFLRQYGEGKDLAYICSFVQFNSLLKKFKICFYAIIRAAKDRYYNSTRKEIIFLITIKFVIFALIISLGFCFTKNNLNIVFFFLRFLACFIFLFVLPLYSKYEKNLIYYIENYNVEDLIYKSVYKFILSISIGIAFVIVMYLVTTIFHWEIFLLEHIIYMWPYPGGSMLGGGGSMGNGNPGPQGQPPQRPPSPSGEIVTFDKPDSEEEKRGCPGSLRQLKDFEIYDLIQEFRAKNPTCIVPKGSSLIFNPEIHQRNEIGYYKSSRHPFKYYMHSFHDKPVKVYYSTYTDNTNTRVMCANPLPEGFYYFSKKNYKYYPLDISNTKQRDKDLFVKNLDGEYVEFPFKVPKDLKFITSHDDVPANEV